MKWLCNVSKEDNFEVSPVGIHERTEEQNKQQQNLLPSCQDSISQKCRRHLEVDWPILVIGPRSGTLRNVAGVDRMLDEALVSRGVVNTQIAPHAPKRKGHTANRGTGQGSLGPAQCQWEGRGETGASWAAAWGAGRSLPPQNYNWFVWFTRTTVSHAPATFYCLFCTLYLREIVFITEQATAKTIITWR